MRDRRERFRFFVAERSGEMEKKEGADLIRSLICDDKVVANTIKMSSQIIVICDDIVLAKTLDVVANKFFSRPISLVK